MWSPSYYCDPFIDSRLLILHINGKEVGKTVIIDGLDEIKVSIRQKRKWLQIGARGLEIKIARLEHAFDILYLHIPGFTMEGGHINVP
jgi:hypothetical protein